jgi:hypothetical protein
MASFGQALFTANFWLSGLAIIRYIPRSFRVKPVDGSSFFSERSRDEFASRVRRMTSNQSRQWGTMTVAQMLHHLNLACGSSLGFYQLPDESYLVSRTVFRWILVDWFSEQPVGLRLPAGFKIPHEETYDFLFEQRQLLAILDAAWKANTAQDWQPHCMFGKMTPQEWGKLLQIHVDYHLNQFAA